MRRMYSENQIKKIAGGGSGGGSKVYEHNITITNGNGDMPFSILTALIYSGDKTPFTFSSLNTWLGEHNTFSFGYQCGSEKVLSVFVDNWGDMSTNLVFNIVEGSGNTISKVSIPLSEIEPKGFLGDQVKEL